MFKIVTQVNNFKYVLKTINAYLIDVRRKKELRKNAIFKDGKKDFFVSFCVFFVLFSKVRYIMFSL
jgi:hypothetical protein